MKLDQQVRCPYCITAYGFRELTEKPGGEFVCRGCGHTAWPDDPDWQCSCARCRSMTIYIELNNHGPFQPRRMRSAPPAPVLSIPKLHK